MDETRLESIKAAYERICASHDQIADFRAKLLALLPVASVAGIFFLFKELVPDLWQYGAFNFRQNAPLGGFIGATGAALVIYPTVISGWIYVSAVGLVTSEKLNTGAFWFFITAWLASFIFVVWLNNWQKKSLKVAIEELERKEKEIRK